MIGKKVQWRTRRGTIRKGRIQATVVSKNLQDRDVIVKRPNGRRVYLPAKAIFPGKNK